MIVTGSSSDREIIEEIKITDRFKNLVSAEDRSSNKTTNKQKIDIASPSIPSIKL